RPARGARAEGPPTRGTATEGGDPLGGPPTRGRSQRSGGEPRRGSRRGDGAGGVTSRIEPDGGDRGIGRAHVAPLERDAGELELGDHTGGVLDPRLAQLGVADRRATGAAQALEQEGLLLVAPVRGAGSRGSPPASTTTSPPGTPGCPPNRTLVRERFAVHLQPPLIRPRRGPPRSCASSLCPTAKLALPSPHPP